MISPIKADMQVQIVNFLRNHDLAVVATVSDHKIPEAATVGYYFDDDFNFYFLTRKESRKAQNLARNPNVAAVVGTTAGPNSVQLEGKAEVLQSGSEEYKKLLVKFAAIKVLYYGPFLKMAGIDFVIVKVEINWLRWLDINEMTDREEFYQLLPETNLPSDQ